MARWLTFGLLLVIFQLASGCTSASPIQIQVTAEEDVVQVDWEVDDRFHAAGFIIQRELQGSPGWTTLRQVAIGDRQYRDPLPPSTNERTYRYRVMPAGTESGPSQQVVVPRAGTRATPTPVPTRTPIPTPTPVPPPTVRGSQAFDQEVAAAVELLKIGDPDAFVRYNRFVRMVHEDARDHSDFCAFARPQTKEVVVYANCATRTAPGEERTRRLAALLTHEATHLEFDVQGTTGLSVQFDSAWLRAAVADITARYQARETARFSGALAPEIRRAYGICDGLISEVEATIARTPGAPPAAIERARAQARAGRDRCYQAVGAQANDATRRYSAQINAEVRRTLDRDWVTDYLQNLERELNQTFTPAQRGRIIESECWAQHEGLVTYSRLGGTQVGELHDVLFLNQPECRNHLNLG